ncbi:hypothetical protein HNP84_007050 [Thermocatellispora tengchongensis]|uniref:Uncharacterized protein n=1 Tax=Thermocatellispora tengchongensis TaxID=1073253 RepID=A0A840PCE0_9ACTN|nr:hypothetical protein [Thermocatellispora tengchongensis]MBB5137298.1 hypothetical protein [Thermocatellispora tengchongensis]
MRVQAQAVHQGVLDAPAPWVTATVMAVPWHSSPAEPDGAGEFCP